MLGIEKRYSNNTADTHETWKIEEIEK